MRGTPETKLLEIAEKIPIMPTAKETIGKLKSRGRKIAIISSGLPTIVVRRLAADIQADYAFGFEVGLDDSNMDGEICGDVIEHDGKYTILSRILAAEKMDPTDCVVVADDRNNVSMFRSKMLKIGYNPDFLVRLKADQVVTGKLDKILPIIDGQSVKRAVPAASDFLRETIHFSAIIVPILAMLLGLSAVVILILAVVALYTLSELVRMEGKNLPLFSQITNLAASQTERYEFVSAPLYFAMGILLTLVLFPAPASSAAIAIFAAGDSTASIFGGFSKKVLPINKGKSLEGTIAGFIFAFLAGSLFITPWKALIGAFVAITIEAAPLPVNDNILMPLLAGLSLTFLL